MPALVETGKEPLDVSKLPNAESRRDGDSKYQALPTRDLAPALVEIGKGSPDLSALPTADHQPQSCAQARPQD